MGNIVLLDELTINKIAAGEVIERPASVIKEMMENSIDAGATNITVEIRNGGISYIRIVDNGKGISSDDLEMAFERHATSKIRNADDLSTVTSMGFRGEALASIAAVANVELVSKTEMQDSGYKIVVEGGKVLKKEEVGCQKGTTITVQNLFFNTPVRYKFLKKDYTESGYIEDAVTRIALVHPEIAIRLINTGKTVIQTTGNGDLKSVIYSIYGKDVAEGVIEESYVYDDIKIKGVVGKPEICRSNKSNQIFFVNQRYVKDKNLSAAVTEGFKGMIPIGKFGFVILNIEMNPSKVDVNVHPAKLEVRFEEENKVFKAIYHTVKDALAKTELVENVEKTQDASYANKNVIPHDNKEKGFGGFFNWRKPENEETEDKENILAQIYNNNKDKTGAVMETQGTYAVSNTDVKAQLDEKSKQAEEKLAKLLEEINMAKKEAEEGQAPKIEEASQAKNEEEGGNVVAEETATEYSAEKENAEANQTNEGTEEASLAKEETKEETEDKMENKEEKPQAFIEDFAGVKSKIDELMSSGQIVSEDFKEMYLKTFGTLPPEEKNNNLEKQESKTSDAFEIIKDNNVSIFEGVEEYKKPKYKFIGIAFNTYIIFEIDKELYILDQHAAHERIMYEKVKKNYYSEDGKNSQMLLLPDIITLTHKEMDIAKENMKMFEKAGFVLEEFGENTIKLSGVPDVCLDINTKELFLETLDEINTIARTAKQEIEERFLATVACKAAVKANMVLAEEEVNSLLDKLLELPNPFTCPHGRPTTIKMTKYDIERKFARK